jgi:hypothetical protein
MDTSDPAALFLPTLDRARAAGLSLPPGEPEAQHRVAALVVIGTILRRESWDEEMELGGQIFASLQMGDPPVPQMFIEQSFQRLVKVIETHPCRMCNVHPGHSACRICGGSGQIDFFTQCSCRGGFVLCRTCLGSKISNQVRIRYLHDRSISLREVYVPSAFTHVPALFSFERALEKIVDIRVDPPECLRCHDLSPRTAGATAYRGGGRETPPDFRGHDFTDTIDKALKSLAALGKGGAVILYEIRAYAWPVLWLHYQAHDVAIFTGRDGALHAHAGAPPP